MNKYNELRLLELIKQENELRIAQKENISGSSETLNENLISQYEIRNGI